MDKPLNMQVLDPVKLTADLVRCKTVTPAEGGALDLLESILTVNGFDCRRIDRNGICNLFASWGDGSNGRVFGYSGHTDVVPVGNPDDWTRNPFGGAIIDGILYGRGATDMKSSVAAFVSAAIIEWMEENNISANHFLVGEPTNQNQIGDMVKIGRRGAITLYMTITGVQGHSAYPHLALNPVLAMVELLHLFSMEPLDQGNENFDPSTLTITTIDVGNPTRNVIPASCTATINIRFNDIWNSEATLDWANSKIGMIELDTNVGIDVKTHVSGQSFISDSDDLVSLLSAVIFDETGVKPTASTSGGMSDARYIVGHCLVIEFGLTGNSMHKVDERVAISEINTLRVIYLRVLEGYFGQITRNESQ